MKRYDYFGNYDESNVNLITNYLKEMESAVEPYTSFGHPFFKGDYKFNYYEYLKQCTLNQESMRVNDVYKYLAPLFQNMPNWINPGTMINVIPPSNLAALAASCFTSMYNPNLGQDTYSGLLLTAEMEVVKYISDLIGWDWKESYGTFTFGGKGTNLYGAKIALNKADPTVRTEGALRNKYFMVTSQTCHPCHFQVCDWIGIGSSNCLELPVMMDGRMDLVKAEDIISKKIEEGYIFIGYNLNGGSTNELTIDPIEDIYNMNLRIKRKYSLDYTPHIHVDTVLGWIGLFFNKYDFEKNELNIDERHLKRIKSLNNRVKQIIYADSVGVDFHKTGFCTLTSSVIVLKNRKDYFTLNPAKEFPLEDLEFGKYNPFETTLELSRGGHGIISALVALKCLGINGFQDLVGNLFSSSEFFREKLSENNLVEIINKETEGFATLFIIKPKKYQSMTLNQIMALPDEDIANIRDYNVNYGKYVLKQAVDGTNSFVFTSSRSYVVPGTTIRLGALKAYPMSIFLDYEQVNKIINEINLCIESYVKSENINNIDISLPDNMVYGQKK